MFWPSKRNPSAGFTLTEVLIAIVILATGLLLIIEGMGRSQHALRVGRNLALASMNAENLFTDTELFLRERLKLSTTTDEGTIHYPGKEFKWTKEVHPYRHPSIEDETKMQLARVTVSWQEGARQNELKLESLLLNREEKA